MNERHGPEVDLLLTDIVLPGMSGTQIAQRLQQLRPALKVLFMSGYTDDAELQQEGLGSGASFLPKPHTATALVRKVRKVLNSG